MFEIEWTQESSTSFVFKRDGYTFRKKVFTGRTVYSIAKEGDVKYNTTIEHRFKLAAYRAIKNEPSWWLT